MQYITVQFGMRGWFACIIDSMEGPIRSSPFSFKTSEEAIRDAIIWAEAENLSVKGGE